MMGPVIDRNFNMVKALIRSVSEGVRIFKTDPNESKAAIKVALRTDDPETIEFAAVRTAKVLEQKPFPTSGGVRMVLEELAGKEPKARNANFEDFVDLRALKELEREGAFK
jgi:hypothetical protein